MADTERKMETCSGRENREKGDEEEQDDSATSGESATAFKFRYASLISIFDSISTIPFSLFVFFFFYFSTLCNKPTWT